MSPYRVAPIKPYEPRPRTWTGRLRSLWRKVLVWKGGTWRRRFERCRICGKVNPWGAKCEGEAPIDGPLQRLHEMAQMASRDSEAPTLIEPRAIATWRDAVARMGVNAAPIAAKLSGWTNDGGPW